MALAQLISQAYDSVLSSVSDYAGDVSAREAWDALGEDASAVVIDVRTQPEWQFVGVPNLASLKRKLITLSWRLYPDMDKNQSFLTEMDARSIDKETPIFMLCRTGVRSRDAAVAATKHGYKYCFNIAHGFEGDANKEGIRGDVNGWKAEGLPWQQM